MTRPKTMAEVLRERGKLGPYPAPEPVAPEPEAPVDAAAVRAWAAGAGVAVNARGPLPAAVVEQYLEATRAVDL
jgi:hypothetical protein